MATSLLPEIDLTDSGQTVQPRPSNTSRRTRTSEDPVGLYLDSIGRYQLLTPQDEQTLAAAIAAGRRAKDELETANGGLNASRRRKLRALVREGGPRIEDGNGKDERTHRGRSLDQGTQGPYSEGVNETLGGCSNPT